MARFRRLCAVILTTAVALAARPQAQNAPAAPPAPAGQQPPQPAAEQPPAPGQPPVFRTGINFVRVDVIVSDKAGNPVGDLKPEDFEITEQGKPQKVETFKLVSLDGGLMTAEPPRQIRTDYDEESEAARDDVRLFAIFLDDYHVTRNNSMAARQQVARFVETQLGPSDMIGLMYPLEPIASVRMTRNHDAVAKGINQFLGRKYDYTPRNELEEKYAYYPTEVVERIRIQVSLSALKSLVTHMGGLKEGRKALILVSEGYTYMLPPQLRDPVAAIPGVGNPNAQNPNAGSNNDPNENRAAFMAGADMESDLRDLTDAANRNNVTIYAVDPRGLATSEFGIDQNIGQQTDRQYLNSTMDTLRTLALNTDGRAIINRNDLTIGMKQIVRDSSAYYLLGYNSTFTATDGKFHEIKVRVKRPGVQVRARKGYWAFTAQDAAKATAPAKPEPPKPVQNALASIAQPVHSSRVVRTWIGADRGANGKTKVTFVWEPSPRAPGDPPRGGDIPARVTLTAVGPDGTPYFRGRVPDTPPPPAAAGAAVGPTKISFDAQPGKMQLRVSVESAGSEVLDSEVREIAIPDLTSPDSVIGTPAVFRARTVREFQQLKTDAQAAPTAAREFSRSDRVFVRVPVYGQSPTVTAKLLNRAGDAMSELPASGGGGATRDFDLTLSSLPPGEYLVEISTGSSKELVGFRVLG
jgi:VWFA-related protein